MPTPTNGRWCSENEDRKELVRKSLGLHIGSVYGGNAVLADFIFHTNAMMASAAEHEACHPPTQDFFI